MLKEPVAWKPSASRPIVLDFSFGASFQSSHSQTRFVADGVRACLEYCDAKQIRFGANNDLLPKYRVLVVPSSEKWTAFWHGVDRLGAKGWKHEYSPEDVGATVLDGMQWQLKVATRDHTRVSNGFNAFPKVAEVKQTTLDDQAFKELQKLFNELLGYRTD